MDYMKNEKIMDNLPLKLLTMSIAKENWLLLVVCGAVPCCIMIVASIFIIPFSVTLSVAVDRQHDAVQCDIQKTAYVSSISEAEEFVIVTLVNPQESCSATIKLPLPQNGTLSLQETVTVYEECWCRCYSHNIQPYRSRCPKRYYWEPPNAENDCNVAIGFMSFIVAAAGLVFVVVALWECSVTFVGYLMVIRWCINPQSFETV